MLNLEEFSKQFPGIIVWKRDINFVYTESNFECARLLGFKSPKEMIGQTYANVRSESVIHADTFQKQDNQVIATRVSSKYIEVHQFANKVWKILYVNKSPLIDGAGRIFGTVGYGIDITQPIIMLAPHFSPQHLLNGSYNIVKGFSEIHLSPRQTECLYFLIRGKTAKEIARILKISHRTVETHIEQLKVKFMCQTKSKLIEIALNEGLGNLIPEQIFNNQISLLVE